MDKNLCYRRQTARRALSVETWFTGAQLNHGRPHIGANGVPGKMDEKLKSVNMQKRAVF